MAINSYIAENNLNGFSLDTYLKSNLGFQSGKNEKFNRYAVWEWLGDGGYYEDIPKWYLPYIRSLNHFHNPITEEGFKGDCLGSSLCVSSTKWALMPLGTQSILTGNYSWFDVRAYYYTALTGRDYSGNIITLDKTQRDAYFAETFRGLGQLMHLIQDMSVPEHSRNDGHYLPYVDYESWVKRWVNSYGVPIPDNNKGHFFTGSISSIKSFVDTDIYTGLNPGVTTYSAIGLSEYSNANFFSEDILC